MRSAKTKQQRKGRGPKRGVSLVPSGITIPRIPGRMRPGMPIVIRRTFVTNITLPLAPGATSGVLRYKTNCPDEIILTGTSPIGWAVAVQQYNMYRVLAYKASFNIINNSTANNEIYIIHQNTDPGATASVTRDFYGNRLESTKHKKWNTFENIGPIQAGDSKYKTTTRLGIAEVVGTDMPLIDNTYQGVTSTIPADQTWMAVAAFSLAGGTNVDISVNLTIEQDVEMYNLVPQNSLEIDRVSLQKIQEKKRLAMTVEAYEALMSSKQFQK